MKNKMVRKALAIMIIGAFFGLTMMSNTNANPVNDYYKSFSDVSQENEQNSKQEINRLPLNKICDNYTEYALIFGFYYNYTKDGEWYIITAILLFYIPISPLFKPIFIGPRERVMIRADARGWLGIFHFMCSLGNVKRLDGSIGIQQVHYPTGENNET